MFVMGFTATGILWTYWQLHLMPFMPLQKALFEEFEDSSPRVEGGQRKIHKHTPPILRVVMRVPFDPTSDDEESQKLTQHRLDRIETLAAEHTQLADFEIIEVHLFQEPQEQPRREQQFDIPVKDVASDK